MRYDAFTGVQKYKTKSQKILLAVAALAFAAALALAAVLPVGARGGGTQEPPGPVEPISGSPMTFADCDNWMAYEDHNFRSKGECKEYVRDHMVREYSLFGNAERVMQGNPKKGIQLTSDTSTQVPFAGIAFEPKNPSGFTFAGLQHLSTDFNPTDDGCAWGSPRFQLRVPDTGPADSDPTGDNIFVYLGPNPVLGTCTLDTWQNTGDLLETGMFVDTSQLGGTFYHEYSLAVAAYGSLPISSLSLVVDGAGAFPDGEQTVLVDNTQINSTTFAYY